MGNPLVLDMKSEESDLKRQKLEDADENLDDFKSTISSSSDGYDSEDYRIHEEEFERSGFFDFDCSRIRRYEGIHNFDLENSDFAHEPEKTNRDLIDRLCKTALKKYNDDEHTNFEFVRAEKANWHPGAGLTFYITFDAKGDASHIEPIPFLAMVGYLPVVDIIVYDVNPKP